MQAYKLFLEEGRSKTCSFMRMVNRIIPTFRDEPYHGAGDYNVPYGGVPTHNTWPHPDVQQLQASQQQDARQQRCESVLFNKDTIFFYK